MSPSELWGIVHRQEAAGFDHEVLITRRDREPNGATCALLPGLTARIVGTERHPEGGVKVFADVSIPSLRCWLERRGIVPAVSTTTGDHPNE